jgi:hypothetical protein
MCGRFVFVPLILHCRFCPSLLIEGPIGRLRLDSQGCGRYKPFVFEFKHRIGGKKGVA